MTIYHYHHIIPRHMGGSDDTSNLIKLTVEEHALAHKKLWEEHGNEYDRIAWRCLSGIIDGEQARIEAVKFAITGVPKSDEHRKKISESRKKDYQSNHKLKEILSNNFKGNNYGKFRKGWIPKDETKKRMSDSAKNRKKTMVICDICKKEVTSNNLKQHQKFSHIIK